VTRKTRFFSAWPVLAAGLALHGMAGHAADRRYRVVENWAQFPPGVTKWGSTTGVVVTPGAFRCCRNASRKSASTGPSDPIGDI
jgi:hypothetical protein